MIAGAAVDGHRGKAVVVVLPVAKVGIGDRAGAEIGLALVKHHELFGMRVGNWIEQHRVDDGEKRRVRADAERERQDRDGGEAGALAQCANGEAKILQKFVEPAAAPLIARDVLRRARRCRIRGARIVRLVARIRRGPGDLAATFEMRGEFVFQFALLVGFRRAGIKGDPHASLSFLAGSSTPAMASVSCAHRERSESRRFFPPAVSLIDAHALLVLGSLPVGGDPFLAFEAVEGGVERAGVDLEDVAGVEA